MRKKLFAFACLFLAVAPAWADDAPAYQALNNTAASYGISAKPVEMPVGRVVIPISSQESAAEAPALPDELIIHERVLSFMDTFDLKSGNQTLGTITEKFFSLTKSFRYESSRGECVALARSRFFSWGTHIDVTDCQDHKVGAIKENVLKSLFKVYTLYSILDAQDREIATSEKVDWISTDVTLRKKDGRTIAELHRPWFNLFSDNWTVKIADHQTVDSRLIVMIAAYKTSVDNDRRREENSHHDDK